MSAEVDHFRLKINPPDDYVLVKTALVPPGEIEPIDFFDPTVRLLISCGIDNFSATVLILGSKRALNSMQGKIFKGEDDDKGEWVSVKKGKIKIEQPQELQLILRKGRRRKNVIKELFIYLSPDDGVEDGVPQESEPLVLA